MPNRIATFLGIFASLFYVSIVEASPSGIGNIEADFVDSDRLVINYTVQGNGSGTADFSCRVVSPMGRTFNQEKKSTYWDNGSASAQFVFINLQERGDYSVKCEWKPYRAGVAYYKIPR